MGSRYKNRVLRATILALLALAACSKPQPAEKPMSKHTNRLAKEKSPYLLQHAHNPVDWWPWCDEAFAEAKERDVPVFLSIGYSTCHWCHVMERESFENEAVAKVMNDRYVCIKVDREERPDVDQVYMAAVHAMGQHGGWPLSVWLTPERKPFFGGTYFPPHDAFGRPGFVNVLTRLHEAWTKDREKIMDAAKQIAEHLAKAGADESGALDPKSLERGFQQAVKMYDSIHGGFGGAPKFPRSVALEFLLRYHARTSDAMALVMVEGQLKNMMNGGIYDHLGGGFSRYSTDEEWLVPHFEKMLYDNALLVRSYVQAWQITKNPDYARVIRETIDYVLRDMTSPDGAFYSAEDADSEDFEGTFYLWKPASLKAVVPGKAGDLLCRYFDVTEKGNFFPHEEREPKGNSILHPAAAIDDLAKEFSMTDEDVRRTIADGKKALFAARARRVRPHRDDKVLLSWNGLMVSAMAQAGAALDEPAYIAAAQRAADLLLAKLKKDGRLLRRLRDGDAAFLAGLDDYACFIEGLIDLYQATFKVEYIEQATTLALDMIDLFGDPAGSFFSTGKDQEQLIARMKETYDGAVPSGIAVATHDLLRLSALTGRSDLRAFAELTLKSLGASIAQSPYAIPHLVSAYDLLTGPIREIVIAGDSKELLRAVRTRYLPNAVLAACPAGGADGRTIKALPVLEARKAVDGRAAAFVCQNKTCSLPVTDVAGLEKLLK